MASNFKIRRAAGFSIIQLLISLALLSAVGVFVFFVLREFGETGRLERAQQEMLRTKKHIESVMMKDLDLAIRADGSSRSFYMGIRNPAATPPNHADPYDDLTILSEAFGEFSFPVNVLSTRQIESIPEFFDTVSNEAHGEFAQNALTSLPYLSITNIRSTNILKRSSDVNPNDNFLADIDGFQFSDYQELSNTAYPVREIQYRVIPETKNLVRILDGVQTEVLAQNVERFTVSYTFRTRKGDAANVVIPETAIRHIQDPSYYGSECTPGSNCVDWGNVDSLVVDISIRGEKFSTPEEFDTNRTSFSFDIAGNLLFDSTSSFHPARFALLSGDTQVQGMDITCLDPGTGEPRVDARCKPSCKDFFTDRSWPPTAAWEGYGRNVGGDEEASDYCKCATNPSNLSQVTLPPSGVPWWNGWQESSPPTAANKARLDACFAFYGCDTPWLVERHNSARFICGCLQPRSDYIEFETESYRFTEFTPLTYQTSISQENKKCGTYRYCDIQLQNWMRYYDPSWTWPGDTEDASGFQSWKAKCGCLKYNEDENGEVTTERTQINWLRRCNRNFRKGVGPMKCDNTWVGDAASGGYLLESADNRQGLTLSESALCECMIGDEGTRPNGSTNISGMNGDGPGLSNYYDFRGPDSDPLRPNPDLSDLSGYSPPHPGSTNTNSVDFQTYADSGASPVSRTDVSCDAAYCNTMNGMGCCSALNLPASTTGAQAQYANYSGYCSNKCSSSNALQAQEIQRIRDIIRDPASNACVTSNNNGNSYNYQSP